MRELMRAVQEAEMTLYNRKDYEHNIHTSIAIIKHGKAPARRLHKVVIYLHMSLLFWACAFRGTLVHGWCLVCCHIPNTEHALVDTDYIFVGWDYFVC